MRKRKKIPERGRSSKEGTGMRQDKGLKKNMNLGKVMRKFHKVEDILYRYTSTSDFVYEDMDFTIEEFSDMTGCDLEELMEELREVTHF